MTTNVQIGYDENDTQALAPTTAVAVSIDTRPGPMMPLFVMAPAMAPVVSYTGPGPWTLNAVQLFYNDMALSGRRGGG